MCIASQAETVTLARRAVAPPAAARSILVSMNPHAGAQARHNHARRIVDRLRAAGYSTEISTDLNQLSENAALQHKAGKLRAVLACGGDGTAAVVRSKVPFEIPLAVVPMGTENLLSGYLRQSVE